MKKCKMMIEYLKVTPTGLETEAMSDDYGTFETLEKALIELEKHGDVLTAKELLDSFSGSVSALSIQVIDYETGNVETVNKYVIF